MPTGDHSGPDEALPVRQAGAPARLREPSLLQALGGFSAEEVAELQQTTTGAVMT